ncbi:MAG: HNH endonuclease [Pyrinomonadaceae bacterium]|nr:HNH endonuclease [Pyrinomonadaceae bacterium]
MASYLYVWNPKNWNWDDIDYAADCVVNGDRYDVFWSCLSTRSVRIGDRFILIRLGKEPKGILGCGYISSLPYSMPHWNEEKRTSGVMAPRTDLLFKALSAEPIIPLDYLIQRYPNYHWTSQASGVSLPDLIVDDLFAIIQDDIRFSFTTMDLKAVREYSEGKPKKTTTWTYDRSTEARNDCIEHYGYKCEVCRFDFGATYGDRGRNFIEVHHLKPIADIKREYKINPIKDLRPVCANCHKMLHRRKPVLSIEELRALMP